MHVDQREFELQVWNGKEYEPVATGRPDELQGRFAAGYGPRRIVDKAKNRPLKPRYRVPGRGPETSMSAQATIAAYAQWAWTHGVRNVHVYDQPQRGVDYKALVARNCTLTVVPVADFLGPAPAPESDE